MSESLPPGVSLSGVAGPNGRLVDLHTTARMQYVIIEHFRNGAAAPVYRQYRDRGRLAPDGVRYVASWVSQDFRRCFQIMECDDPALFAAWMAQWRDIVDFAVVPAMTSSEAAVAIAPRL